MELFGEICKHLQSFGQEVAKHAGPAAAEALNHAEKLSQEAGRNLEPAGAQAWHRIVEVSNVGILEGSHMLA
jgi:hypothetical protein